MKITIEINMDNSAFDPDAGCELREVLERIALRFEDYNTNQFEAFAMNGAEYKAKDTNGNTIGSVKVTEISN